MNGFSVAKDSASSPLRIASLELGDGEGCLGLTICPGKKDSYKWNRDLEEDLSAIRKWGASTVVTLIELHEFKSLKVDKLGARVQELGTRWIHLPIRDVDVPDQRFEEGWTLAGPEIHDRLSKGEKIVIHCRGGLGRTGLVAGLILVERGCAPQDAIQRVRSVRPNAIETAAQERFVLKAKALSYKKVINSAELDPTTAFKRPTPPVPMRERYQGCLLGGAVGDALGAPVEFLSRAEILRQFGPSGITEMVPAYGKLGAITDDTQMTLFTAEGALRAYVRGSTRGLCHIPSVLHRAYLRWLHTQGVRLPKTEGASFLDGWLIGHKELFAQRAPGRTCIESLRSCSEIGKPAQNNSKGCGGVMRIAPVGMLYHALTRPNPDAQAENFKHAFDTGCHAAALTHGHPTGFLAAGVMAALVFDLLGGADLSSAIDHVIPLLAARQHYDETLSALEHARDLSLSSASPKDAIQKLGGGWVAEEALAIAVYCALTAPDFEQAVILAVNHDGDSDSTGLIAGHLSGAMRGLSAIPKRWLAPLELRNVIEEIADDLATARSWNLSDSYSQESNPEDEYYFRRYPGF